MNFTTQVVINRPRPHVLELISDPGNLAEWQPGLKSIELLSGARNQVGARSRVVFEFRGFRLVMIESVVAYEPPDLFSSLYEARGVRNLVENRFFADGPGKTRWVLVNNFKISGWMSVVSPFLQDSVPQQNRQAMQRFKEFAEHSDGTAG
jgi:uncharacterized membrane protein